jgi:hypothetical protein
MTAISEAPTTCRTRGVQSFPTEAQSFSLDDDVAKQWRRVLGQLHEIRSLQDNWDGMGAIAPPTAIVDSAIDVLYRLSKRREWREHPASRASVAPDGTVIIDWQGGGNHLEAQLTAPNVWEWMHVFDDGRVVHYVWRL